MLKQIGGYVLQNHEHGKLYLETNLMAEIEHNTKEPHCTKLVC